MLISIIIYYNANWVSYLSNILGFDYIEKKTNKEACLYLINTFNIDWILRKIIFYL
jgi:hypothetical protein